MITLPQMIASLAEAVNDFPDKRTGKNTKYSMSDVALGAFSVFFTQSPSFLAHQREMQKSLGLNNAHSLFGMIDLPSDNHIRDLLDQVPTETVFPVFDCLFEKLKAEGYLNLFRTTLRDGHHSTLAVGDLLLALDGTDYFSSERIHCDNCFKTEYSTGEMTYSHSMITPAIVSPDRSSVIPLIPEYITPQDGDIKQDFEIKAAKRWIKHFGTGLSPLGVTVLGDDLYSHQPICEELLTAGFNFILVAKDDSHKTLYEWVRGITQETTTRRWTGKFHEVTTYKYVSNVPIRDKKSIKDQPLQVNFVEVEIVREETGKLLYRNSFITNHPLTDETVEEIVSCGRARWKIENEQINTLKTKGYHLEHNFGHGKKTLSQLLASFTLIAFLMHTIMDLTDTLYRELRQKLGSRKNFFNAIRNLTIFMYFKSWTHLFTFMIEGLKRRHLAPDYGSG